MTNETTIGSRSTLQALSVLAILCAATAQAGVWTSNGPRGGIVRSLAVDPAAPSTVYAGTSSGGIFKSANGGGAWSFSSAGIPQLGDLVITGLAVDPTTSGRVYATAQSGADGGILRSTNGGTSWTLDPLGAASAVAVDPATPTTLYATGADVWKSVDAGVSWNVALDGGTAGSTYCVAIDPVTQGTVYVGHLGWISKTTDAGATWTTLFAGLPGNGHPVAAIAIDPATPTTLYAGTYAGVFKSVDAGLTWTDVGPGALGVLALAIDPADPDVVYAGGLGADAVSVYKTVDGGTSWTPSPVGEATNALALLGPTTLLAGTTDVGTFRTTDAGTSWVPSNAGLVATAVLSLATDAAQPGHAYAGTVRNGVARTADGGDSWIETASFVNQGITAVAIDSETPGTAWAGDAGFHGVFKTVDDGATWFPAGMSNTAPANAYALLFVPATEHHVWAGGVLVGAALSTNGGASWVPLNTGLPPSVVSLAIHPTDRAIVYAGTDPLNGGFLGVFKTTDNGQHWNPVNTGLPVGTTGVAIVGLALDPSEPAVLYAAVEDHGVFKTTDAGATWTPVNGGLGSLAVSSVAIDAVVANRVYAGTLDQGVFMTDDGGATWIAVNDGLVHPSVRTLATEPGRVYAGTGGNGTFVMEVDVTTTTSTSTSSSTTSTSLPPALLGRAISIRDPRPGPAGDPAKRKIVVTAKEPAADETLNPFTLVENGGSLTIAAFGATPSAQTWRLSPPLWTLLGTTGARYDDKLGLNGPVKRVVVRKSASGTFEIKATVLGKLGPGLQPHVLVVPPNPGVAAKMVLQVHGGDAYCTGFGGAGGGVVGNGGDRWFKVTKPTAAVCP